VQIVKLPATTCVGPPSPDSNREGVMQSSVPQCEIALMLCESLIHLLVEEGVIAKHKAIEAIEGVADLASEMAANGSASAGRERNAAALVETIAESFRLKD